jgi:ATP-dependent RNA helicase DDX41
MIFCGQLIHSTRTGLGHVISNCPKLEDAQRRLMASHRPTDDRGY